ARGVADAGQEGPLVHAPVAEIEGLQADHVRERAALGVQRGRDVADRAGDLGSEVARRADSARIVEVAGAADEQVVAGAADDAVRTIERELPGRHPVLLRATLRGGRGTA